MVTCCHTACSKQKCWLSSRCFCVVLPLRASNKSGLGLLKGYLMRLHSWSLNLNCNLYLRTMFAFFKGSRILCGFECDIYTSTTFCVCLCVYPPLIGLKKLKKESLGTCFVTVRTVPRPLCFCFFLIVFTVTSFPLCQSIWQLERGSTESSQRPQKGQKRSNLEEVWRGGWYVGCKYRKKWTDHHCFTNHTISDFFVCSSSHPSQSMISGPSNEKGSVASGSDFIL